MNFENPQTNPVPTPSQKAPLIMKLKFEELGVYRRAALGLLPRVNDPEHKSAMTFSDLKSSRKYKFLGPDKLSVSLEGGYRLCRATRYLPIKNQKYYWEIDFTAVKGADSHIRLGIATIEADMEAPVGVDVNGYCIGDLGKCIHNSRRNKNCQSPIFHEGDTIGVGFIPGPNYISLQIFKNGVDHGIVFNDISRDKRWTPAVSVYREATVTGRFIRPFKFDPGNEWTAAGDIPRDKMENPISAKKLVKVMKGTKSFDQAERDSYMATIYCALTPAHLMPI